jgi:hypothetical protein
MNQLKNKLEFFNIPSLGALGGTSTACLLLRYCPNSSNETLEIIGGSGLILSLGINLYRSEEAETFLHGFTTGLLTTMVISVPFLFNKF